MTPETLIPAEHLPKRPDANELPQTELSESVITDMASTRQDLLESIKETVSRKTYYLLEEKLKEEQKQLREILGWQQGRQSRLSKYTNILDRHYFEQEFLN